MEGRSTIIIVGGLIASIVTAIFGAIILIVNLRARAFPQCGRYAETSFDVAALQIRSTGPASSQILKICKNSGDGEEALFLSVLQTIGVESGFDHSLAEYRR